MLVILDHKLALRRRHRWNQRRFRVKSWVWVRWWDQSMSHRRSRCRTSSCSSATRRIRLKSMIHRKYQGRVDLHRWSASWSPTWTRCQSLPPTTPTHHGRIVNLHNTSLGNRFAWWCKPHSLSNWRTNPKSRYEMLYGTHRVLGRRLTCLDKIKNSPTNQPLFTCSINSRQNDYILNLWPTRISSTP